MSGEPITTLYHVTHERNWPSISRQGLLPQIGPISKMLVGPSKRSSRVYFFTTLSDARWFQRAAKQFFVHADLMEPEENLILIAVDIQELKKRGIRVRRRDVLYHNINETKLEGEITERIPSELLRRIE